ncbi:MAG: hypothetical protein AAF360_02835, partial [Pseudomonadota bacterium]
MTKPSHSDDKDWDALNALADGRLSPSVEDDMKARLEADHALAADLAAIANLKTRLSTLRTAQRATRPRRLSTRVAAAACAAGIAVFVLLLEPAPSATDAHARFVARVDASAAATLWRKPAKTAFEHLDFSTFGLKPVQTARYGDDHVVHYVGARGCRITLIAGPGARGAARAED